MNERQEWEKWASNYNLSRIIGFHNNLRSCMRDALASDKTESLESTISEARWQDYDTLLHANTFLMLYAHTEEWLYLSSKKRPEFNIDGRGSISRYRSVVLNGFNIDVSDSGWQLLIDSEKIRNCLLHANGRIDLMKNKSEIETIVQCRHLNINLMRLQLPSEFLALFAKEVEIFIHKLK